MDNQLPNLPPSLQDDQQQQYIYELNDRDVLCGRGSGPNDRVGNIEFRNLVLSRKAEYLAAPSRDVKGRIANEVVDAVRSSGGRFIKKLNAKQLQEKGFKKDMNVYELADESTVLEKAKQTLRQNRANFVKEHGGVVDIKKTMRSSGRDIPTQSSAAPMSNNNNNWGVPSTLNNLPQTLRNTASSAQNLGIQGATSARNLMSNLPTGFGSLNPISMSQSGSDVGLDSAQHPKLSANTAQQLNEALNFASSNNGSSMSSSGMMMMQSNNMMPTANSSSNTSNNNLSLNTAELASAAGMGLSDISGSNGMSTTSAQAYSALLREYSMKEEDMLMQQFLQQQQQGGQGSMPPQTPSPQDLTQDQVQQQFEQLQQQQQFIQQQQSLQSNAPMIQKGQQPQSYPGLELLQNEGNVFGDLLRTYTEPQVSSSQPHQQEPPPQPQQFVAQPLPVQRQVTATTSNTSAMSAGEQNLLDQFQQLHAAQQEILKSEGGPTSSITQQQQQRQQQHPNSQPMYQDALVPLNDTKGSYTDQSVPLRDVYQPESKKKQPQQPSSPTYDKKDSEGSEKELDNSDKLGVFDPTRRRRTSRRRSTLGADNRSGNTSRSDKSSGTSSSIGLSNIEPGSLEEDEPLSMSYKTAQHLAKAFDADKSLTMSGLTSSKKTTLDLDSSMLSLMSLSLNGGNRHGNSDDKLLQSLEEESGANDKSKTSKDNRIYHSGVSFGGSIMTVDSQNRKLETGLSFGDSIMSLEDWNSTRLNEEDAKTAQIE